MGSYFHGIEPQSKLEMDPERWEANEVSMQLVQQTAREGMEHKECGETKAAKTLRTGARSTRAPQEGGEEDCRKLQSVEQGLTAHRHQHGQKHTRGPKATLTLDQGEQTLGKESSLGLFDKDYIRKYLIAERNVDTQNCRAWERMEVVFCLFKP